jgi:toxin ParE1/3/4
MGYRLSPKAEADLVGIADYIAQESPAAASQLIERIEKACAMVGDNPLLGPARPEIAPDTRAWVVDRYLILYRPIPAGAEIVRVVHGARNLEELDS